LIEEFTEIQNLNFPEEVQEEKISYDIEGFDEYKMVDFFIFLKEKL